MDVSTVSVTTIPERVIIRFATEGLPARILELRVSEALKLCGFIEQAINDIQVGRNLMSNVSELINSLSIRQK